MLDLISLSKSFGSLNVLNQISASVEPGQLIHLYGHNGCGKSTLFKCICDCLKPDSGQIIKKEDTLIGALIENPGFLPSENLAYNLGFLANLCHRFDLAYTKNLCERLNLNFDHPAKMKTYSLGMKQKVGIIQAIMEHQNLILLDEPTRGLDQDSLEAFAQLVHELVNQNKSVIIASHDQNDLLHYTHDWILDHGKLCEKKH